MHLIFIFRLSLLFLPCFAEQIAKIKPGNVTTVTKRRYKTLWSPSTASTTTSPTTPKGGLRWYWPYGFGETGTPLPNYFIETPKGGITASTSSIEFEMTNASTVDWDFAFGTTPIPIKGKPGYVTSCFACGMDVTGVPAMPGCPHAFGGEFHGEFVIPYVSKAVKYKKHCYRGNRPKGKPKLTRWYGNVTGGCFKRFTDVGIEYSERGCREKKPARGISFASRRYTYLERSLMDVNEGCTFSPMASLTPFSRSISLYVRYHVCVCHAAYCNRAPGENKGRLTATLLEFVLAFIGIKRF